MAIRNTTAEDITLSLNGVLFGCIQSGSLEMTREEIDAVCAASGAWAESIAGRKSWSMSYDSLLRITTTPDAATNYTASEAFDDFDSGDTIAIEWTIGTAENGGYKFSGSAFSTGLTFNRSSSDAQTWSGTLKGTGALVKTPLAA
jgi:predicted secreted protein